MTVPHRFLAAASFMLLALSLPCRAVAQDRVPPAIAAQLARGETVALASLAPVGARLPDFSYSTLGGRTVGASTLVGQPTVLIFWTPSCTGGTQIVRALDSLRTGLATRHARLWVVDLDSSRVAARRALGAQAGDTEVVLAPHSAEIFTDPAQYAGMPAGIRKALVVPGFLVLDAAGVVRASETRWVGVEPILRAVEGLRER